MNRTIYASLLAALILGGCSGKSLDSDVPPAKSSSEDVPGVSWLSRAMTDAYLRSQVWTGTRSGFVVMFARKGQPIYTNAVGWANIEAEQAMQVDTRMRFASMTKPVTAVAAMTLVEDGVLGLDDPVAKYIPAFAATQVASNHTRNSRGGFDTREPKSELLVRHLLMFSSGIGPGIEANPSELHKYWDKNTLYTDSSESLADRINRIAAQPLFEDPGTKWRYGWSADVLARVVEVASGIPYDSFLKATIFAPLGMDATSYLPAVGGRANMAKVYTQDEEGNLVKAPARIDASNWTPGGSGLVSTAGDYMRFALMLWNGGEYQGARILKEETIAEMTRLHVSSGVLAGMDIDGVGWGLGMAVMADAENSLIPGNNGEYWWNGYYGTTFFVDPQTDTVGVLLSQNEPKGLDGDGGPTPLFVAKGIVMGGLGD
ncbi:MAG: serine hydrolase domain-containing protein [Pseudomonadota bacterium]